MNNDEQEVKLDNLSTQADSPDISQSEVKQPVETTQPTQPVDKPESQTVEEEVDWKKRYDNANAKWREDEAKRVAAEEKAQKYEALITNVDSVYREDRDAFEKFRSGYNKKNPDAPMLSYEELYQIKQEAEQQVQQANPNASQPQQQVNIDELVTKKLAERDAYQTYFQAFPNAELKKLDKNSDEYKKEAELDQQVTDMANTLVRVKKLDPGPALIEARKFLTGESAKEIDQVRQEAKLEGFVDGLKSGSVSTTGVPSGATATTSGGLKITDEHRRIAQQQKMTPERVAQLDAKGLL